MKYIFLALTVGVLLGPAAGSAWSQHEGHGGMAMPKEPAVSRDAAARSRVEELTNVQEKIDALEEKLENPKLSEKKRAKLKLKIDKLYEQKNELLAEGPTASKDQDGDEAHHHHEP
jgi:hypothetical protein